MNASDDILREGDPKRRALDKIQGEVTRLKAEIASIERGPLTPADVRESLARGLDQTLRGPSRFEKFDGFLYPASRYHAPEWAHEITWGALVAIFGRDDLIDRVATHVERNRKEPAGLPLAERAAAIAKLREKLEAAERKEELEIIRLEAEGLTILRREDCNVELILDVHRGLGSGKAEPQPGPAEPERAPRHINEGAQLYQPPVNL